MRVPLAGGGPMGPRIGPIEVRIAPMLRSNRPK